MKDLILVFVGAGIGGALRYGVSRCFSYAPIGTALVNIVGSFAMGVLIAYLAQRGEAGGWRLFLGVGVLGGFTTFSAFSMDAITMLEQGSFWRFAAYIGCSVVLSLAFFGLGFAIGSRAS